MAIEQVVGTLENFQYFTRDCHNIVPHQGASPDDFLQWELPLDLVFLDGVHHNPIFWKDLNFWFWRLKPGGLCCGDDFARTHPDVVWGVQDFAKTHGLTFLVQGRIWMIPRPPHKPIPAALFGDRAATVPDLLERPHDRIRRRELRKMCSSMLTSTARPRTNRCTRGETPRESTVRDRSVTPVRPSRCEGPRERTDVLANPFASCSMRRRLTRDGTSNRNSRNCCRTRNS